MPQQPEDRREKLRLQLPMPVLLKTPTGELHGMARDVSIAGAFVTSKVALSVGTRITITFTLPIKDARPFRSNGTVVRSQQLGNGNFGSAIAFDDVGEES